MTRNPICTRLEARAEEALQLMEERPSQIRELPVVDENNRILGLLRLHDLLQVGFHLKD
ncbi:CBS domain protein [compost metagenome]